MAGTSAAVIASIVSGGAQVGASVLDTINKVSAEDQAADIAGYNAAQARADAQRIRGEYAMNAGLQRANARRQIASAENEMTAGGNIGPSADAAVMDAYFNLSSDLAAMKYQYDNRAVQYLNQAQNYDYQKKVAKRNKTSAIFGGILNTVATAGKAYTGYNIAGGKYGFDYFDLIRGINKKEA